MKHQSPKNGDLTAAATLLTSSYVNQGGEIATHGRDKVIVSVDYTKGDETSMEMQLASLNTKGGSEFIRVNEAVSGATITCTAREYKFTATGKYEIIFPSYGSYLKAYFKATGGTPTGTVDADYRLEIIEKS